MTPTRYAMPQEWITDRPPTEADGDMDGDVNMVTAPGADFDDYVLVHWSYVGDAVPWQHTPSWRPPAEPAPTEPDRIAALEQRVTGLLRAQDELIAAMANRLEALEAAMRPSAEPPKDISYEEAKVEHLRALTTLLRAQVEAFR